MRGFFLQDKNFSLKEEVATTIAQIACDGSALPQGSPCSPVISELIGQILDMCLIRLAKKYKVTYTRYADDITFSTNKHVFPKKIAYVDTNNPALWHLGNKLIKTITHTGFIVNNTKTRMSFRQSQQIVTGLVVNKKVNVQNDYYRRARAMCHQLFQTGSYYKNKENELVSIAPLEGILNYIYNIYQKEDKRTEKQKRNNPRTVRVIMNNFLFYKYFISLERPLIIAEGETDIIYIREAAKKHIRKTVDSPFGKYEEEKFEHNISYFKYKRRHNHIMGLCGGTGDLTKLVLFYSSGKYSKENKKMYINL